MKTLKLEHKIIQPYICIFITSSSKVVRLHIFFKIKVRIVNNPEIPSCRALLISYYGDYSFLTGPSKNLKTGALALVMAQLDDSFWSHRQGVTYISIVRLAYKSYFFSKQIVFFSHNKSANGTFSHDLGHISIRVMG